MDAAPAQRLNRAIARKMLQGRAYAFLATPVAGSGIPASHVDLLTLAAILDGAADAAVIGQRVGEALGRLNMRPMKDGKALTEAGEEADFLHSEAAAFLAGKLSVWCNIGVL